MTQKNVLYSFSLAIFEKLLTLTLLIIMNHIVDIIKTSSTFDIIYNMEFFFRLLDKVENQNSILQSE